MITNFQSDIKKECIHLYIPLLTREIAKKFAINSSDINIVKPSRDSKIPNVDRLIYFYSKNHPYFFPVEFKTDDITYKTRNIVIEVITSIKKGKAEDIPNGTKIRVGSKEHDLSLALINKVKENEIKGNIGFGIMNGVRLSDKMLLSYLTLDKDKNIRDYLVLKCKELSKYLGYSCDKRPLFKTESHNPYTGSQWNTIGILMPLTELQDKPFAKTIVGCD